MASSRTIAESAGRRKSSASPAKRCAVHRHVAGQESDGTYTILKSYSGRLEAENSPEGDFIIQTYEEASGISKLVGRIAGGAIGGLIIGNIAGWIVLVMLAGATNGEDAIMGYGLGWLAGVLICAWIGQYIVSSWGRKDVFFVTPKMKLNWRIADRQTASRTAEIACLVVIAMLLLGGLLISWTA